VLCLALCFEGVCQGLCPPAHILVAHVTVDAENDESARTPPTDPCHQTHFNEDDDVVWAQLHLEILECSTAPGNLAMNKPKTLSSKTSLGDVRRV
jgi:hypothetical protein